MRRGSVWGIALGAAVALGLGVAIALLPTTPTWALWRLTVALDDGDVDELTRLVDVPAVTLRAVHDLQNQDSGGPKIDLGRLAKAVLSGERVGTIFDDPDHPLEVTPSDFLAAWWGMRREEGTATLTLEAGGKKLDLILEQRSDLDWKVVGVSPIGALLRIEPPSDRASLSDDARQAKRRADPSKPPHRPA
ncbi:MAG: DUF2939 domain-containing protein [Deltaproteobacteria bacterium]|nr:DUF2939 domain-containing protein [Deltaproteobacteria bacterium]